MWVRVARWMSKVVTSSYIYQPGVIKRTGVKLWTTKLYCKSFQGKAPREFLAKTQNFLGLKNGHFAGGNWSTDFEQHISLYSKELGLVSLVYLAAKSAHLCNKTGVMRMGRRHKNTTMLRAFTFLTRYSLVLGLDIFSKLLYNYQKIRSFTW